jgi:hypothetical protein
MAIENKVLAAFHNGAASDTVTSPAWEQETITWLP